VIILRGTRIGSCNLVKTMVLKFTSQSGKLVQPEMNRVLLEKLQYFLSNASLDKFFWVEAIVYASHLLNRLPTTAIGDKTLLQI